MSERERIFQGDTLPIVYETRKPNPDDPRDSRGLPVTPSSAVARLFDRQGQTFLPVGGGTVITAACTIEPQTGPEEQDRGALVSYTVPAQFTAVPGDYSLYITATFPDGAVLTEDRQFKILEFR